MKTKKAKLSAVRYFTWAHNVDGCLENGSFVRLYPDGMLIQYMNGDNMGSIDAIPEKMTEVPADKARKLLPQCCR